jgi:hypothetical protein
MATVTWGAVAGNWSDGTKWSGGAKPANGDDVVFDAASANCVVNENTAYLKSLDQTGYTGVMSGSSYIYIRGLTASTNVCLFANGASHTWNGRLYLSPVTDTAQINLTWGGMTTPVLITTNTSSAPIFFLDAITMPATASLVVNYGVVHFDGLTDNAGLTHNIGILNSNYNVARTINLGNCTLNLNGTGTVWNIADTTSLTMTPGASTVNVTDVGASAKTVDMGSAYTGVTIRSFWNMGITGGGAGGVTIVTSTTAPATWNNFTIGKPKTVYITINTALTVNGILNAVGDASNTITLRSSSANTKAILNFGTTATFVNDYLWVQDLTVNGVNKPYLLGPNTYYLGSGVTGNTGLGVVHFRRDNWSYVSDAYFYDASVPSATQRGTTNSVKNCDVFPDDFAVGDAIYFMTGNSNATLSSPGKFLGLRLNVDVALAGTGVTGVWEYQNGYSGSIATPTYAALSGVTDGTNGFTTTGLNDVTWTMPTDWANYSYAIGNITGATSLFYRWVVRYRITGVTTRTEGGHISNTGMAYIKTNALYAYGFSTDAPLTPQILYNQDVAYSWGAVTKQGLHQWYFNCNLKIIDTYCYFNLQKELMEFGTNYEYAAYAKVTYGTIVAADKCKWGSTVIINGDSMDCGMCFFGYDYSYFLNSQIRISTVNRAVQGPWGGGVGSYANQVLYDCYFEGFRQNTYYGYGAACIGLKSFGAMIETPGNTIQNCTQYGGSYAMRPTTTPGHYVHQCDMSGPTTGCIQVYYIGAVNNFTFHAVDCLWGTFSMTRRVQYVLNSPTVPYTNGYVSEDYSLQIQVVDANNVAISGATAVLKDVNGTVVWTYTTNPDGFIGSDSGTTTAVAAGSITDTGKSWGTNALRFFEVLITSGTGITQRRIIKYGNTATNLPVAPDYSPTPAIGDRYIIIPYVTTRTYVPTSWTPAGASKDSATPTELNPFTLTISKSGYKTYQSKLTISKALNEIITLSKVKDLNFSKTVKIKTQ